MKLKRLIAAAGLATVLAIGVGTGITINREAERVDAVSTTSPFVHTFKEGEITKKAQTNKPIKNNASAETVKMSHNAVTTPVSGKEPYLGFDTSIKSKRGVQIGSSKAYCDNFVLSFAASEFGTATDVITKVSVKATTGGAGTISLKDGSKLVEKQKLSTENNTLHTFVPEFKMQNIDLVFESTSKAMYFSEVAIEYGVKKFVPVVDLIASSEQLVSDQEFTVTANASNFADEPYTYEWSVATPTTGSIVSGADLKTVNVKAIGGGELTLQCIVNKGKADSITKSLTLNVKDFSNALSINKIKSDDTIKGSVLATGVVIDKKGADYYIADAKTDAASNSKAGSGIVLTALNLNKNSVKIGDTITVDGTKAINKKKYFEITDGVVQKVVAGTTKVTPIKTTVAELNNKSTGDLVELTTIISAVKDSGGENPTINSIEFKDSTGTIALFDWKLTEHVNANKWVDKLGYAVKVTGIVTSYYEKIQFVLSDGFNIAHDTELSEAGIAKVLGFLDTLKKECGTSYVLTQKTWDAQGALITALSAEDKAVLKAAAGNKDGKLEERFASLYDFCLGKYDFAKANNFVERATASASNDVMVNNSTMIITIVAISTIAVSAIALLVIFKRRKATR